jgi:diguanylate cyclase (GGDEF)-like protein
MGAYETLRISISAAIKGSQLLSKIRELSVTDELTGLYNRRGFFQLALSRLNFLSRSADDTLLLLMFDLDGLKQINDTYGHSEGDTALKSFADILKQTLRQDDIIGRIGGDEFIVFS